LVENFLVKFFQGHWMSPDKAIFLLPHNFSCQDGATKRDQRFHQPTGKRKTPSAASANVRECASVNPVIAPVGEHQEIAWDKGPDSTQADNRKPNIVLIVADHPGEMNDVAGEHPEIVEEIMILLAEHNAEMVPPLWESIGALPINVDKHLRQEMDPEADTYIYWSN
jgi:hypothetical protein